MSDANERADLDPVLGEQANGIALWSEGMNGTFTRHVHLEAVDSTNRFCSDAARAGEDEGLVVTTRDQFAGRGRRGRQWIAPAGSSLFCSLLFRPAVAADADVLTTIVGLSAVAAIRDLGATAVVKWPNDVVISEKKVAGVLAELVADAPARMPGRPRDAVVVGIGMNLSWPEGWPPDDDSELLAQVAGATTVSREIHGTLEGADLFARLLDGVDARYDMVREGAAGRGRVMDEYRSVCATIGTRVRVELDAESFEAEAVDIDGRGRLCVRRGSDTFPIEVGDVVHLRDK